jgi:hypothetical protein
MHVTMEKESPRSRSRVRQQSAISGLLSGLVICEWFERLATPELQQAHFLEGGTNHV